MRGCAEYDALMNDRFILQYKQRRMLFTGDAASIRPPAATHLQKFGAGNSGLRPVGFG